MTLEDLTKNAIEDLGLARFPEDQQQQILKAFSARLDSVTVSVLLSLATEEQKAWLEKALSENREPPEVVAELASQIPGLTGALEQALSAEYDALKEIVTSQGK